MLKSDGGGQFRSYHEGKCSVVSCRAVFSFSLCCASSLLLLLHFCWILLSSSPSLTFFLVLKHSSSLSLLDFFFFCSLVVGFFYGWAFLPSSVCSEARRNYKVEFLVSGNVREDEVKVHKKGSCAEKLRNAVGLPGTWPLCSLGARFFLG